METQKTFFVLKDENTCFDATLTNARGSGYTVIELWAASNGGFFYAFQSSRIWQNHSHANGSRIGK